MGIPPIGDGGGGIKPTSAKQKETIDVPALVKQAEVLTTDLQNPDGINALKTLIDNGYYKEAGTVIANIIKQKCYRTTNIKPENLDAINLFFTKIFLPGADKSQNVDTNKIFCVICHSGSQKNRLIMLINSWLSVMGKQNAIDIISGRLKHVSLFEKTGAVDENGDGVIGTDEPGYTGIKEMDSNGNGVSIDEFAIYAITHPNITYSKELIDSILVNIKGGTNKENYLALLQTLAKSNSYAKYQLAVYNFGQGHFKEGIILLHEYVTQNPDADTDIIELYHIYLSALGLKEDLSNIDGPNNIQLFEDLAYFYTTFHSPNQSCAEIIRTTYAYPNINPLDLSTVQGIKSIIAKCTEILSQNPNDEKLIRLKTKLEGYIKEFETSKGAGQIRMSSNGKPLSGNLTITSLEQTVTIYMPSFWNANTVLTCQRYQMNDHVFYDYMYSQGGAVPTESGNPLMVKLEIPAWKFLKLISPGEESVKVEFEFQNKQEATRTITLNINIPPEIWGTGSSKQPDAAELYQRMMGDVLEHYEEGQSGPAVLQGTFTVNADKDHPELKGKNFKKDRFYDPRMDASPFHALEADGFKCVKVLTEKPTKPPESLEKPDTALPDTSYTVEDGQIVQKWGYPKDGDQLVVISPREVRIYEKRIFPKDMKGGLKAEFDKLPKEVQEQIAKEGIVIRITVPFYTDTIVGTTYYQQQLPDDSQFFIAFQSHLPFSQSYITEELISSPDYKPRTKPGVVVAIHCDSGATTTPLANAYGNLITPPGPKDKTYGNPYPAIYVLGAIIEGKSNQGIGDAAISGQAKAQGDSTGRVRGVWGKSEKATGGHIKDTDTDGLPDVLDPNPTTQNIYYYDKLHSRLIIYNPVTDKEVVLKDFALPKPNDGFNYSAFEPLAVNKPIIKHSLPTLSAYNAKKSQARLAYLQHLKSQEAAKGTE